MNVVSSTGDVLHHPHHHHHPHPHHHPLNVSVGGGTDEEGDFDSTAPDEEGRSRRRPTRGQSRIEFERLAAFFHVPINEAAKGLGVCATVLKKVCRKHGIPRWPHRKIKKLDTMLAMLETAANKPGNPQHDDDVRKKIDAVMRDREVLMTEGKLVSEGKSDHRRKAEGGRPTREVRKRKKPDDDEEADNEHDTSHDNLSGSYSQESGVEQEAVQSQLLVPMGHMATIASSVELNNMSYPYSPYANYATQGGGIPYMPSNGLIGGPGNSYSYNPVYWNTISLPGVNSISSGVISSNNAGMMMHNMHPPLSHSGMNMAATPISPLTPNLLSSSNPLPIPLHGHKHAKLSHSDVLLDHGHYSTSSYPPSRAHLLNLAQHNMAYSDFSVQQDGGSNGEASSHYRMYGEMPVHPTTASE